MLAECWLVLAECWLNVGWRKSLRTLGITMYICMYVYVCWFVGSFSRSIFLSVSRCYTRGLFSKKTTNIANKPTKSPNPLQHRRFQCWLAASKRPANRPTFPVATLCERLQQPCPGSGGLGVGLERSVADRQTPDPLTAWQQWGATGFLIPSPSQAVGGIWFLGWRLIVSVCNGLDGLVELA